MRRMKFEAFVMQSFIQEMMPETPESVFGSGISGDFWKSMMAEKIAEQVAERGNIGIADMIRNGHVVPERPSAFNLSRRPRACRAPRSTRRRIRLASNPRWESNHAAITRPQKRDAR